MKRRFFAVFCLTLCVAGLFGLLPAAAENTTIISWEVESYYEFVIPDTVSTDGTLSTVTVRDGAMLPEGTCVAVSVAGSSGGFRLTGAGVSVPYSVLCGGKVLEAGQVFLTRCAGAEGAAQAQLVYRVDADITENGVYTDTLTFRAALTADKN